MMKNRFDMLLFPGGKSKVFTLSYDDGVVQDKRLTNIIRSYGAKATFNLNAATLGRVETTDLFGKKGVDISTQRPEELSEVYAGQEIAGHGLTHANLSTIGTPLCSYEIVEDKRRLEALTGQPLRMFAYPFGTFSDDVVEALRLAGYQGARTVRSTHSFALPEKPLLWDPTCHHDDPELMALAHRFVEERMRFPMLFYVWGHAYEFDNNDNWQVIEELLAYLAEHKEQIWFAANGEILAYLDAYRRLEYSVDGSLIYNPSARDVLIAPTPETQLLLKAGELTQVPA